MFLSDFVKVLESKDTKGDKTIFATVQEKIIKDGEVKGYKVALGDETATVDCDSFVNAEVGDLVSCLRTENGSITVNGRRDGDALIVQTAEAVDLVAEDLASNYDTSEEVDRKIAEIEVDGKYQIVEYARSSSQTTAPTSGWSEIVPELTSTYKYLWARVVEVENGVKTVVTPAALSTTLSGMFTFVNAVRYDSTTIDGGNIYTQNLNVRNGAIIANWHVGASSLYNGVTWLSDFDHSGSYIGSDGITYSGVGDTTKHHTQITLEGVITSSTDNEVTRESILGYGSLYLSTTENAASIQLTPGGIRMQHSNTNAILLECGSAGNLICSGSYVVRELDQNQETYDAIWHKQANGTYKLARPTSARKDKENISDVIFEELNPNRLYELPVRQFTYKGERASEGYDIGFIADEVEEYYPVAATYDEDDTGEKYACYWNVRDIVPAMLKLIQDQHIEIELLKERLS